jgi:hypothetical protein
MGLVPAGHSEFPACDPAGFSAAVAGLRREGRVVVPHPQAPARCCRRWDGNPPGNRGSPPGADGVGQGVSGRAWLGPWWARIVRSSPAGSPEGPGAAGEVRGTPLSFFDADLHPIYWCATVV